MDIASVEAGTDFEAVIRERLSQCNVFIALIGRNWARCTNQQGRRRLEEPDDFVRFEIAHALQLNMRIIPVLVGGARMPSVDEIPSDLRYLTRHNAHEIPDQFFRQSVRQLIRLIRTSVPCAGLGLILSRRSTLFAAGGLSLATGGVALAWFLSDKLGPPKLVKVGEPGISTHPPVIIKAPVQVSQLPPPITGPWKIDKADFASDVIGPQRPPRQLWATAITFAYGKWSVVGFAPDKTPPPSRGTLETILVVDDSPLVLGIAVSRTCP